MLDVFNEKYYRNLNGGILEAFGILFSRDLKMYLYPWSDTDTDQLLTSESAPIYPRLKPLYDYLIFNKRIVDIKNYNADILHIYSRQVLQMIKDREDGWEDLVPTYVDTIIKDKELFGYKKGEKVK